MYFFRRLDYGKKPIQYDESGHRKFGIRDSVAYAAGDLGCNMSFALKGTMVLSGRASSLFGHMGGGFQWWVGLL